MRTNETMMGMKKKCHYLTTTRMVWKSCFLLWFNFSTKCRGVEMYYMVSQGNRPFPPPPTSSALARIAPIVELRLHFDAKNTAVKFHDYIPQTSLVGPAAVGVSWTHRHNSEGENTRYKIWANLYNQVTTNSCFMLNNASYWQWRLIETHKLHYLAFWRS